MFDLRQPKQGFMQRRIKPVHINVCNVEWARRFGFQTGLELFNAAKQFEIHNREMTCRVRLVSRPFYLSQGMIRRN